MTVERYLWWMVLAWCFRRSWDAYWLAMRANLATQRIANPAGSEMIARCVRKIDQTAPFVGAEGFRVSGTHPFAIGDRRFLLIVRECSGDA